MHSQRYTLSPRWMAIHGRKKVSVEETSVVCGWRARRWLEGAVGWSWRESSPRIWPPPSGLSLMSRAFWPWLLASLVLSRLPVALDELCHLRGQSCSCPACSGESWGTEALGVCRIDPSPLPMPSLSVERRESLSGSHLGLCSPSLLAVLGPCTEAPPILEGVSWSDCPEGDDYRGEAEADLSEVEVSRTSVWEV